MHHTFLEGTVSMSSHWRRCNFPHRRSQMLLTARPSRSSSRAYTTRCTARESPSTFCSAGRNQLLQTGQHSCIAVERQVRIRTGNSSSQSAKLERLQPTHYRTCSTSCIAILGTNQSCPFQRNKYDPAYRARTSAESKSLLQWVVSTRTGCNSVAVF